MKAEDRLKRIEDIGEQVQSAVAEWSPTAALLVKGLRFVMGKLQDRGDVTPEEAKAFDEEIARVEGFIEAMQARGDEYKRLRAEEDASGRVPL